MHKNRIYITGNTEDICDMCRDTWKFQMESKEKNL